MTQKNRKAQRSNSGFTLVELLMVVCILGILYAGAKLVFTGQDQEARITTARGSIQTIEQACQMFSMSHNGKLPDTLAELTEGTDEKPGLLKEASLVDPWGTEFGYQKKGRKIIITCAGPDCEMGTEDDITN